MTRLTTGRGTIVRDTNPLGESAESLEVAGRIAKDWTLASENATVIPSVERATAVRDSLKEALRKQLEQESATLGGGDIGNLAIHGRTGVSTD
jgi:hypothetical protein